MIAASITLSTEHRQDLWLIGDQVMACDAVASRRERAFVYSSVQPVAMNTNLLGKPKDRPLPLYLGLRLELFGEGDLSSCSSDLRHERGRNVRTSSRMKAFGRNDACNLMVLIFWYCQLVAFC